MINNKKGISSIIATLILVLLTIVLIGVVWVVVSGIVNNSTKQTTSGAECLNSEVQVSSATCSVSTGMCNVVAQRTQGTDTIGGVRLVLKNPSGATVISDVNGSIQTLASVSASVNASSVMNVSEVDAAIYFTDAAGNKNVCSGAQQFTTVQITA